MLQLHNICPYFCTGPNYLKRVCSQTGSSEEVKILTIKDVNQHVNQPKEVMSWIGGVKEYLTEMNDELIKNRKLLFFLESQIFRTNTEPKRLVSVMVIIIHSIII